MKDTCPYGVRRRISRDSQSVTTPKPCATASAPAPQHQAEECRSYPSKQNTEMQGKPLRTSHTLNTSQGEHSAYRNFLFPSNRPATPPPPKKKKVMVIKGTRHALESFPHPGFQLLPIPISRQASALQTALDLQGQNWVSIYKVPAAFQVTTLPLKMKCKDHS